MPYFKRIMFCLWGCMLSCIWPTVARAEMIIAIDNLVARAGDIALVNFYISSSNGTDVLSGFNLPIDFNNDGFVDLQPDGQSDFPVGFSLAGPALSGQLYANTGLDTPFPQIQLINVDAIATGSGSNRTLSQPVVLFTVGIQIDSSVAAGTVLPIQIIQPAAPFQALLNVSSPGGSTLAFLEPGVVARGSITVASVPEPTACFIIPSLSLMLAAARRRRSRKSAAALGPD